MSVPRERENPAGHLSRDPGEHEPPVEQLKFSGGDLPGTIRLDEGLDLPDPDEILARVETSPHEYSDKRKINELRNIAAKYDQIHQEMTGVPADAWTPRPETERVLSGATKDVRFLSDRLDSLAAQLSSFALPNTTQAVADLQRQISELKDEMRELRATVAVSVPVRVTALDHIAGSLARITICTLIVTLIAGPVLAVLATTPFSPWVAKMVDVSFSSLFASTAAEIGVATTRKIDG
jgi:hypothetical protein